MIVWTNLYISVLWLWTGKMCMQWVKMWESTADTVKQKNGFLHITKGSFWLLWIIILTYALQYAEKWAWSIGGNDPLRSREWFWCHHSETASHSLKTEWAGIKDGRSSQLCVSECWVRVWWSFLNYSLLRCETVYFCYSSDASAQFTRM